MKRTTAKRKKSILMVAAGGLMLGQLSAVGGCLPDNYLADLTGAVIESVVTSVALDAVETALNPAGEA